MSNLNRLPLVFLILMGLMHSFFLLAF